MHAVLARCCKVHTFCCNDTMFPESRDLKSSNTVLPESALPVPEILPAHAHHGCLLRRLGTEDLRSDLAKGFWSHRVDFITHVGHWDLAIVYKDLIRHAI